jgi:hypothetical protein
MLHEDMVGEKQAEAITEPAALATKKQSAEG